MEYQFKTCYARILDAKGKFTEAALRYYDLSQTKIGLVMGAGKQVGEADLAVALTSASRAPSWPPQGLNVVAC